MSVLIKGMEMPKSCDKCELMTANYGCAFVGAVGGESYRKRAWDCPLVEVPEGRVFGIRDGILYEATVKIPDNWGKTIKIPQIKLESEGE